MSEVTLPQSETEERKQFLARIQSVNPTKDLNPSDYPVWVRDLTVAYHRKPVLWDVNLALPDGKLIGIIGPNGAGKSTLIKSILGIQPSASGDVKIFGKSYKQQRKLVGYVPQRGSVDWDFPVNALDVVLMGRYGHVGLLRRVTGNHRNIAMECLEKVGMQDFANRQINQLSGGQQQRVFLARALAQDAQVYFMDEPFAGVDAATEKAIVSLLRELKDKGRTCIIVHHDLQTVTEYFDHLVLLNMRVVDHGPTDEVFTPEALKRTYGGRLTIMDEAIHAAVAARR